MLDHVVGATKAPTTAGLFVVGLMATVAQRIGAGMAATYTATYANPGMSLGWEAYLYPLAEGFLLAGVFAWRALPL